MRRVLALALMTALCLSVCACGGKAGTDQLAKDIGREIASARSITAVVSVTADYGERVYKYKLRCTYKDSAADVEALEPDGIKGLKAHVTEKGLALSLGGVALDTGGLTDDGLSPLEAVPVMIRAWTGERITETKREKAEGRELLCVTYDISKPDSGKKTSHTAWFDVKTRLPVKAEIISNGYRVINCSFGNIIME